MPADSPAWLTGTHGTQPSLMVLVTLVPVKMSVNRPIRVKKRWKCEVRPVYILSVVQLRDFGVCLFSETSGSSCVPVLKCFHFLLRLSPPVLSHQSDRTTLARAKALVC